MKTTAKSSLRLVLVAGGTIAKSCLLQRQSSGSFFHELPLTRRRRNQVTVGPRSLFWQKAEPAQRMAPFGRLFSLSSLSATHNGFNNVQLNMMASEPFFYQSVLLDTRR